MSHQEGVPVRYVPAILLVWFLFGVVFVVGYNWARWAYLRKQR